MSATPRGRESDRPSIPPIEIGSFVALRADKSEFIGSASGAFFVNTVFRAFAAASTGKGSNENAEVAGIRETGSPHSYLAAAGNTSTEAADDDEGIPSGVSLTEDVTTPGELSYGLKTFGLGAPPSLGTARKLLVLYFQNWHPFFPFLHGPTFVDQVNRFYGNALNPGENTRAPLSLRSKLCRAITFQCVFNIAAAVQDSQDLEASSVIESTVTLTNLLGIVSSAHDVSSLQALFAMELYLVTKMSLRAASTVHGALTRMLYQAGFHRCPFRFVQLPRDMCEIRKRIFWCVYILDRHLSQALGHPVALRDDEVDVCVPGMAELHRPVKPREQTSIALPSRATPGDEVREHLPKDHPSRIQAGTEPGDQNVGQTRTPQREGVDVQSPAHHHTGSREAAGEYVLGYLVTYSKLLGASLDLFHKSIHKRLITWDNVLEITYRTEAWWNNLPSMLQDDSPRSKSQFGAFFSILYHHLILFINRPFLSLPRHMLEFRSSMQSALSASRSILRTLEGRPDEAVISAWPGTYSATWMAGLVIAFAGRLNMYSPEKAVSDLSRCLIFLNDMADNWPSAGRCHSSLKLLVDALSPKSSEEQFDAQDSPVSGVTNRIFSTPAPPLSHTAGGGVGNTSKRRRINGDTMSSVPASVQGPPEMAGLPVGSGLSDVQDWQPVLEYTGPDFGFDTDLFASRGGSQAAVPQPLNQEQPVLLFDNLGFETYVQHFGDRLNF
ncbi:putative Fungal specific transcription factor [Pleurostoma richardsiae]|uniref:Fungal specific transcription factor n=1 Tax=Pleurostoma richardsiae TaxID=41990 RepID=A0AA38S803_9PEZI|nr:putative Fungal specific transcription factor [Pleurostoma richardsiae]